jgi:charged multivesicular body protein 2A
MSFLFGGPESVKSYVPRNPVRETQSELRASIRTMKRELNKSMLQEKTLKLEIKKCASTNQIRFCTIKAKELVRLRNFQEKLQNTMCSLSSMDQNLSSISSTQVMQETLTKTSKLLSKLNKQTDAKGVVRAMHEYSREQEMFGMKQESIMETVDEAMQVENEDMCTNDAVADVFMELGLDASLVLSSGGATHPLNETSLAERLNKLKVSLGTIT